MHGVAASRSRTACLAALLVWLALAGCARRIPQTEAVAIPAMLQGRFTDDYGASYVIASSEWKHGSRARYRIVRVNVAEQYVIAQNDAANESDAGLWTRIDWLPLTGMAPYTWGYCYSAYKAPTAAAAESVTIAQRATPRTGCNGFPFTRMKPTPTP